jgi:hypothetical protein
MVRFSDLLARLGRATANPHPPRREPPFKRRKVMLEPLEDRLLLSADIAPIAQGLASGLTQFQGFANALVQHADLATPLPIVSTTLGAATDFANLVQTRIVTPAQAYLAGGGAKTTDGLVAAIAAQLGGANISGDLYGDEIRFDVNLEAARTIATVFDLEGSANGLPITATGNGTVDLGALVDFEFSFGFDLTEGIAPEEAFFIRVGKFEAKADVHTGNTLNLGVALGFLDASIVNGRVDLDADVSVVFNNPDADTAGRITLTELLGTTLDDLVSMTRPAAVISANLPVTVSALGSFTGGNVNVALSGTPFAAPVMALTGALASDVENFGRITPTGVVQVLNQVGN